MAVIYSKSTQQFIQELNRLTSIPHNKNDLRTKTKKELKSVRKLYESDTSKFEPIPENRTHLINSLMPMVVKIAKQHASKYNSKVEYNDCISSGLQGAIIATDIYIDKSSTEKQPAKLSTFAHFYITKYVLEYCREANSILSYGPTKWLHASKQIVMSGNETRKTEHKSDELFNTINDAAMQSTQQSINDVQHSHFSLVNELCSNLHESDKTILRLAYGLNNTATQYTTKEIAHKLNVSIAEIEQSLRSSIELLKKIAKNDAKVMLMN